MKNARTRGLALELKSDIWQMDYEYSIRLIPEISDFKSTPVTSNLAKRPQIWFLLRFMPVLGP